MSTAHYITIATLTIVTALISLNLRAFLKAKKDPKVLLPGTGGLVWGSSLAICVGGALGWVASVIAGGGNAISAVVPWATGAGDRAIAAGGTAGLTVEGGIVVSVITAIGWAGVRAAAKTDRRRTLGGIFVGVCLTYTPGVASAVDSSLIPSYNALGAQIVSLVEEAR